MTKFSKDYHDYVFKDGRLVGDFEKMYRHSAEVPWNQDKTAHMVFSNIDGPAKSQAAIINSDGPW